MALALDLILVTFLWDQATIVSAKWQQRIVGYLYPRLLITENPDFHLASLFHRCQEARWPLMYFLKGITKNCLIVGVERFKHLNLFMIYSTCGIYLKHGKNWRWYNQYPFGQLALSWKGESTITYGPEFSIQLVIAWKSGKSSSQTFCLDCQLPKPTPQIMHFLYAWKSVKVSDQILYFLLAP